MAAQGSQAAEAAAGVAAEAEVRQFNVRQLGGAVLELEAPVSRSVGEFTREVRGTLGLEKPISLAIGAQVLQPQGAQLAEFIQQGQGAVDVAVVVRAVLEVTRHVYHTAGGAPPPHGIRGFGMLTATDTVELDPGLPLRSQGEKFVPQGGCSSPKRRRFFFGDEDEVHDDGEEQQEGGDTPEIDCELFLVTGERPDVLKAEDAQVHNLNLEATAEDALGGGGVAIAVQIPMRGMD